MVRSTRTSNEHKNGNSDQNNDLEIMREEEEIFDELMAFFDVD